MSKRQRDRKRRKYRSWCKAWFGVEYDPRPGKFDYVTWQYPTMPKFYFTIKSLTVTEIDPQPMADMENSDPSRPTRLYIDYEKGTKEYGY